jgi:putative transposase
MSRQPRFELLYNGCFAHVFSRSIEKPIIFKDDRELSVFREYLITAKRKYGFLVFHYCLMHTHFHLAVQMPSVNAFAQAMGWVKREYTKWYHAENKRRGTLWQDRYKSLLIENDEHLAACGEYIENNPVSAGFRQVPEEWPFSSSKHYVHGTTDALIDPYDRPDLKDMPPFIHNQAMFETGEIIGSDLFQFYVQEEAAVVPVP